MQDSTVSEDMLRSGVRWAFDTLSWAPSTSQVSLATSAIQPEEKERIGKFVFARDARSSLVGRLMMRKWLSEHCGGWARANISRDDNGKPWAPQFPNVLFNVSHQGRWVVMAGEFGTASALGVDIMARKLTGNETRLRFFRIMERHFAPSEWSIILSKPEDEQEAEFFRFWTLKEAYVKATGTGITVDLRQIAFSPVSPVNSSSFIQDTTLSVNGQPLEDWMFQEILLDADHVACVALKSAGALAGQSKFSVESYDDLTRHAVAITDPDEQYVEDFLNKPYEPSSS